MRVLLNQRWKQHQATKVIDVADETGAWLIRKKIATPAPIMEVAAAEPERETAVQPKAQKRKPSDGRHSSNGGQRVAGVG